MSDYQKYLKYKKKYFELKGGYHCPETGQGFHQKLGECWHDALLMIIFFGPFGEIIQKIFSEDFNIDEFMLIPRETRLFFLPFNFENTEEDIYLFHKYSKKYINSLYDRYLNNIKNKDDEIVKIKLSGLFVRRKSFDLSLCNIENNYELYNHNHNKKKVFDPIKHGGNHLNHLLIVNILNYYFLNDNRFINTCIINKYNLETFDRISKDNIIGILLSLYENTTKSGHAVSLYKCNDNYYYYDDNGINDQVYIKYDWNQTFNMIKNFDVFYIEHLLPNYSKEKQQIMVNYKFSEIMFLYFDEYKSETDYIHKYTHNMIYYTGYNNCKNIDFIQLSLKYPVINTQNHLGTTPLIFAISNNNQEIVKLLLECPDIDLNLREMNNNTALMNAVSNNNQFIIDLILKKINVRDKFGMTMLMNAVINNNLDIVNLLLKQPDVDLNLINHKSMSVLMLGCTSANSNKEIVKLLLNHPKININLQNMYGISAFMLLCYKENKQLHSLFLGNPKIYKKINFNLQNNNMENALMIACSYNNIDIVSLLFNNPDISININEQNKDGMTALMLACIQNHEKIIKILLDPSNDYKIDTEIKNNNGETAIMIARKYNYKNIIKIINDYIESF